MSHYENPRKLYPTTTEKMDFIRAWWRDNKQKFSHLGNLPGRIQASIN